MDGQENELEGALGKTQGLIPGPLQFKFDDEWVSF
jgi:hypothetical protein